MKKELKENMFELYHFIDGVKFSGKHKYLVRIDLYSDTGQVFPHKSIYGDCTNINGDYSGIRGDCTGIFGNCTGLYGNIDDCDIKQEERKNGLNIRDLIGGI